MLRKWGIGMKQKDRLKSMDIRGREHEVPWENHKEDGAHDLLLDRQCLGALIQASGRLLD